jgi:hypothetical protein
MSKRIKPTFRVVELRENVPQLPELVVARDLDTLEACKRWVRDNGEPDKCYKVHAVYPIFLNVAVSERRHLRESVLADVARQWAHPDSDEENN